MSFLIDRRTRVWIPLLVATAMAQPSLAQMDMNSREACLYISGSFFMCDPHNAWETREFPEDVQGIGIFFDDGIEAEISGISGPWSGIQVRVSRYTYHAENSIADELAKIDQFPAVTYISHVQRNNQDVVQADTYLVLEKEVFNAETYQLGDTYTPEHAARHSEMLAAIVHYWSFK